MKLKKFRITCFRSVIDSGWIECDDITTLIGINESGKSNIILALWKLKPVRGGEIDYLHDLPVTRLSDCRDKLNEVSFVTAVFTLNDSATSINTKLSLDFSKEDEIEIQRCYDGRYSWKFLNDKNQSNIDALTKDYLDDDGNAMKSKFTAEEIEKSVIDEVPSFVYYSNYGNLASQIYLPHAIKWLNGEHIEGIKNNESQVRTIRVLFDYVNLSPEEILEYGRDAVDVAWTSRRNEPTQDEINTIKDAKEKRALLLQSAGDKLTKNFRDWWKQGNYKFRFQADGDYFQIWVSDDRRSEEVDLELRSTGLQWFLSFYLVFSVESTNENKGVVLLLDEAGLTLHPLAQKDLSAFFNKLSETNQIINTTHSPFIIDTENIDRCRVVYYDEKGYTVVSENLREGVGDIGEKSIYAVHAALGLTVSDVMFQGGQIVIVEGVSDQYYLTAIKNFLVREGKIQPKKEILFVPSGGVKGVTGITSLVSSKNNEPPFVVLDSDKSGENFRKKLIAGMYESCPEKILSTADYSDIESSEIEDLIPYDLISIPVAKILTTSNDDYDDNEEFEQDPQKAIVPQIENYAKENNITLPKGWKVIVSKAFKKQLLSKKLKSISDSYTDKWQSLFKKFC